MEATISADVISSTSLSVDETLALKKRMKSFFSLMEQLYPCFWGRQIKGDYFELYIPDASKAFRISLLIKTYLKSFNIVEEIHKKLFMNYGARIAIGIGKMRTINRKAGIMDGEAIYLSGRSLEEMDQLSKGSLMISTNIKEIQEELSTVALLTDALINKATKKQCEVIYYKLLSKGENEIAKILHIEQPGVNQRSTAACWYAIERAVNFYEQINFNIYE